MREEYGEEGDLSEESSQPVILTCLDEVIDNLELQRPERNTEGVPLAG